MGNYFDLDDIIVYTEESARKLSERYEASVIPYIVHNTKSINIGYFLYYEGKNAFFIKVYHKSEETNLVATDDMFWTVFKEGQFYMGREYDSLDDVFSFLEIRRSE